jgi:adenylate cyclase
MAEVPRRKQGLSFSAKLSLKKRRMSMTRAIFSRFSPCSHKITRNAGAAALLDGTAMPMEIERKFLIRDDGWRDAAVRARHIRQGYLQQGEAASIRIRIVDDDAARLTIKSSAAGLARQEFEYAIPLADAEQLLPLCRGMLIVKTRHEVPWDGLTWEIDVFEAEHAGLIIAEIELQAETQSLRLPPWLGAEVTGNPRYYNNRLAQEPFAGAPRT